MSTTHDETRDNRCSCEGEISDVMEIAKGTEVIAPVIGRYCPELQPYILKGISEVHKSAIKGRDTDEQLVELGRGADAKVIELDIQGSKCVGKVLHPIFFKPRYCWDALYA